METECLKEVRLKNYSDQDGGQTLECVCHALPRKTKDGTTNRNDLRRQGKECLNKSRLGTLGDDFFMLHTHEVAGSSPAAPTT
jgi:hypothetical protein